MTARLSHQQRDPPETVKSRFHLQSREGCAELRVLTNEERFEVLEARCDPHRTVVKRRAEVVAHLRSHRRMAVAAAPGHGGTTGRVRPRRIERILLTWEVRPEGEAANVVRHVEVQQLRHTQLRRLQHQTADPRGLRLGGGNDVEGTGYARHTHCTVDVAPFTLPQDSDDWWKADGTEAGWKQDGKQEGKDNGKQDGSRMGSRMEVGWEAGRK